MKKFFQIIAIFSFILVFLTSCSKTPRKKIVITFWNAMNGSRGKALQTLVNQFNASHPRIFVKSVFKGSKAYYSNNYTILIRDLLLSLKKNDPPTMAQVYENWTAQFIGAHAIIPLEKFIHKKNGYTPKDLQDFVPAFLKSNEPNGVLWTLPFNKSLYVLYYNKSLFKKEGLKPPATWDNFLTVAEELTFTGRNRKVIRYGLTDPPDENLFDIIFYALGGIYFKHGRADFNGEKGDYALRLIRQMKNEKIFFPDYHALQAFTEGKAAMYIDTTAALPYLEASAKFPIGISRVPGELKSISLFAGTNLAIFKKSAPAQKKAAWIFIKWLLKPDRTAWWAAHTGYLPVRISAIHSPVFVSYLKKHPEFKIPLQQLGRAFTDPRVWAWESIRGIVGHEVEAAIFGRAKIKQALNKAAEKTNLLLAQSPQQR